MATEKNCPTGPYGPPRWRCGNHGANIANRCWHCIYGSRPMLQASIAALRRSDIASLAIHHVRLFGPVHRRCPNGKTVRQVQR